MNKTLVTAMMLIACGYAVGQPADSCQALFPISVCQGDAACIAQAQQNQAECRATQERGNRPVTAVPEPATAVLVALGLIGLVWARKRRKTET